MARRVQHSATNGAHVATLLVENGIETRGCGSRGSTWTRHRQNAAVSSSATIGVGCVDANHEHHRRHDWAFWKGPPDALDRPHHAPHSGERSCTLRLRIIARLVNEKTSGYRPGSHTITRWYDELYEMRTNGQRAAPSFQTPFNISDAYTFPFTYCTPQMNTGRFKSVNPRDNSRPMRRKSHRTRPDVASVAF